MNLHTAIQIILFLYRRKSNDLSKSVSRKFSYQISLCGSVDPANLLLYRWLCVEFSLSLTRFDYTGGDILFRIILKASVATVLRLLTCIEGSFARSQCSS